MAQSMASDDVGGITLNSALFKKVTNLDYMKKGVESKFHPVGCDTLKSTLDHEIGHEIDNLLGIAEMDEIRNLFYSMSKEEITEKLSTYAWQNRARNPVKEFVAEAWSEYMNNPNPREVAKCVGELIEKRYEQWQKK